MKKWHKALLALTLLAAVPGIANALVYPASNHIKFFLPEFARAHLQYASIAYLAYTCSEKFQECWGLQVDDRFSLQIGWGKEAWRESTVIDSFPERHNKVDYKNGSEMLVHIDSLIRELPKIVINYESDFYAQYIALVRVCPFAESDAKYAVLPVAGITASVERNKSLFPLETSQLNVRIEGKIEQYVSRIHSMLNAEECSAARDFAEAVAGELKKMRAGEELRFLFRVTRGLYVESWRADQKKLKKENPKAWREQYKD